jgi:AraC-like DNA-binding protein
MSKTDPDDTAFVFRCIPRVIDLGFVREISGHATRLLDFAVLGIVISGRVGIQVGSATLRVDAGHYYLLPALIPHHGLDTARFDAAFFHFLPTPADAVKAPSIELALSGATPPLVDYLPVIRLLESQYRTGLIDGDELGVQLLAIAGQFAALQRRRATAPAEPAHALARQVLEVIHADYPQELSGSAISARLGYSYAYLERVFRATYGHSIHQELLRTRIQAAAHGLQMGKPIKDIHGEVGFPDYYYFLKAFKRVQGVSPGAFQASYRASTEGSNHSPRSRAGDS